MIKKGREHLTRPIVEETGVPGYIPEGWKLDDEGNLIDEKGILHDPKTLNEIGVVLSDEFKKAQKAVKKQQPQGIDERTIDELTRINLRFKKRDKENRQN